jgi:hypothetical protein
MVAPERPPRDMDTVSSSSFLQEPRSKVGVEAGPENPQRLLRDPARLRVPGDVPRLLEVRRVAE